MIRLTREILHSASTNNCGFNREQLYLLGVDWPPVKGWLSGLIGRQVSDETWQMVVKLKGVRNRKQRAFLMAEPACLELNRFSL